MSALDAVVAAKEESAKKRAKTTVPPVDLEKVIVPFLVCYEEATTLRPQGELDSQLWPANEDVDALGGVMDTDSIKDYVVRSLQCTCLRITFVALLLGWPNLIEHDFVALCSCARESRVRVARHAGGLEAAWRLLERGFQEGSCSLRRFGGFGTCMSEPSERTI
jgi:hypothetical protein